MTFNAESGATTPEFSARSTSHSSVLSPIPARDASTLMQTVREKLRQAVVREELPSGTRLSQAQLAVQLGVSRMPVRAATAELVAEGLLEHLPGGGVTVRPLTKKDLQDVYEVRQAVEAQAVRHVTTHPAHGGHEEIAAVIRRHRGRTDEYDAAQLVEADREFHMTILSATGNDQFAKLVVPVWSVVERVMFRVLRLPGMTSVAWEGHEGIAAAILSGDPDLAEMRLRAHLENAATQLADAIGIG